LDNISHKYNRYLIYAWSVAPLAAYVSYEIIRLDFKTIIQLFSYIGVFLVLLFRRNDNPIIFPRYLLFYLFFVLYVFYSDLIRLERVFKIDYLFKNYFIGSFNFMLIIENLNIPKKCFKRILLISKYILIFAVLVIIYQQIVDPNFMILGDIAEANNESPLDENDNRLLSIYSYLGEIFASGFSFVPIFIIFIEHLDKKKKKVLPWLLMGIIYAFLTKQRWLMVNFSLVFALFFINNENKFKQFVKYALLLPVLVVVSFMALDSVGIDAKGIVEQRILEKDKKNLNQTSASTRLLAFKAFNQLYWDNPIFGTGNVKYGMGGVGKQNYDLRRILKGRSSQIHVGYLSIFYLYGLVGAFLFLGFLFMLLKRLYKNAKYTGYWAPFLALMGLVLDNFLDVQFGVYEMGLIIALFVNKFYVQTQNCRNKIYA